MAPAARPGSLGALRLSVRRRRVAAFGSAEEALYQSPMGLYVRAMLPAVEEIVSNFELLDESNDRLEYLIELGRLAEPLAPEKKTEQNRVRGCASTVWLDTAVERGAGRTILRF